MTSEHTVDTQVTSEATATPELDAPESGTLIRAVVFREVRTTVLRPTYALLLVIVSLTILGIAWSGGGVSSGYVPTIVDLLTPLQFLLPVVAVALGYQAVQIDEQSGELDVLETYPVTAWQFVSGVFLGRALGAILVVALPLALVMLPIAVLGGPTPLVYATHSGADSPWLFLRFLVLSVGFSVVLLAVVVAVSTLVSTTRTAIAAGALSLVVLLFGLDIALAYGFTAGVVGDSGLINSLALSPLSAYRGLVLETAVAVTSGTGPKTASPLAGLAGLLVWFLGSLALAVRSLW